MLQAEAEASAALRSSSRGEVPLERSMASFTSGGKEWGWGSAPTPVDTGSMD